MSDMMHELVELVLPQNLLLYVFAYALGAVPTSYLVARYRHKVTIGQKLVHSHTASYVFRTIGKWSGLLVFCCDVIKGLMPAAIALSLPSDLSVIALVGLCAVVGHCFSVCLGFRGGHGGATTGGFLLIVYWPSALVVFFVNALLLYFGVSTGLSSIFAVFAGAILVFFGVANKVVFLIVLMSALVVFVRHWSSLMRSP